MRVFALLLALVWPAAVLAAPNQLACSKRCEDMIGSCEDQCTQRVPKGKQGDCKHACKAAKPKCEERCKQGKQNK